MDERNFAGSDDVARNNDLREKTGYSAGELAADFAGISGHHGRLLTCNMTTIVPRRGTRFDAAGLPRNWSNRTRAVDKSRSDARCPYGRQRKQQPANDADAKDRCGARILCSQFAIIEVCSQSIDCGSRIQFAFGASSLAFSSFGLLPSRLSPAGLSPARTAFIAARNCSSNRGPPPTYNLATLPSRLMITV